MGDRTYTAHRAVKLGGTVYAEAAVVTHEDTLADAIEELVKLGALVPDEALEDADPETLKPEDGAELKAAILSAIDTLDKDKDYTKAGQPKVKSVEARLGYDISSEELRAALENGAAA